MAPYGNSKAIDWRQVCFVMIGTGLAQKLQNRTRGPHAGRLAALAQGDHRFFHRGDLHRAVAIIGQKR